MLNKFLLAAALSVAVATPALAQSSSAPGSDASSTPPSNANGSNANGQTSGSDGSSSSGSSSSAADMTIRQHLKQDLMKNGFSDVDVIPTSFFVRAKDKSGRHVMMMIGPDSITTITGAGMKASKSGGGADKSGSSDGNSSQ